MGKVIITSYWDEFYKNHPDPKVFTNQYFPNHDYIRKIWKFCHEPMTILHAARVGVLEKYPFIEKYERLQEIERLEKRLDERFYNHDDGEWFRYLSYLLQVTANAALCWKRGGVDWLKGHFHIIAAHMTIKTDNHTERIEMGFFYPRFTVVIEKTGKDLSANINHIVEKPSESEIEKNEDTWISLAVDLVRNHGKSEVFIHEYYNMTIQHWYDQVALLKKPLLFQLGRAFEPLIKKHCTGWGVGNRPLAGLRATLYETIMDFDGKMHPVAYIKTAFPRRIVDEYRKESKVVKGKRAFRADIESSGGSVDEMWDDTFRVSEDHEQEMLNREILEMASKDERLQKILNKDGQRRTVADQKYYQRAVVAIRKKFDIT